MMDAMISRCVDELNKHDEEMKKLRGGSQDAPSHSITTGISVTSTKNFKEDKLKCDIYKADDIQ
jgi:pyruvate/2-oxoacid:ferredoxin oxidoreductase alpha subunit